jgi:hypothetical protein
MTGIDAFVEQLQQNDGIPADQISKEISLIDASDWLDQEPPEIDQIMEGIFEPGDKVAIISSSKSRKSFFLLQMCLCIAAGQSFLNWQVLQKRRVLYVQFEIKPAHMHRRFNRMCRTLGVSSSDLKNRLKIVNGRGLGLSGEKGIKDIWEAAQNFKPEIIVFDPLYKLMEGVENAAEDGKKILNSFDRLIEESGAAILYVHHDAKGAPGDRDIRDRGAGSNVIARDYDACLTLTAHATSSDCFVVDSLLRNYKPQDPFTIQWAGDESNNGYCFTLALNVIPEKKTSKLKKTQPPMEMYLPYAENLLESGEYEIGTFKERFKESTGLSDHRIRDFINWATSKDKSVFETREERGRGKYKKWIYRT